MDVKVAAGLSVAGVLLLGGLIFFFLGGSDSGEERVSNDTFEPVRTSGGEETDGPRLETVETTVDVSDSTNPTTSRTETEATTLDQKMTTKLNRLLDKYIQLKKTGSLTEMDSYEDAQRRNAEIERLRAEIVALGEAAIPSIMALIKEDEDVHNRIFLIQALGEIGGPTAMEGFKTLLSSDADYITKRSLVNYIGDPNDPAVQDILLSSFDEEGDWRIQVHILRSLAQKGVEGPEMTRRLMESAESKDAERNVRLEAIRTLGRTEDTQSIPLLEELIRDEKDVYVRQNALYSYARLNGQAAVPLLDQIARHDDNFRVRASAITALTQVGTDDAISTLEYLAESARDERVRLRAKQGAEMAKRNQKGTKNLPDGVDRIKFGGRSFEKVERR